VKVRVSYTVPADEWLRREINRYHGREGLASRDDVRRWYEMFGSSMDDNLALQAKAREEREQDLRELAEEEEVTTS